jgi:hypothetical protein
MKRQAESASRILARDTATVTRRVADETVLFPLRNSVVDLTSIYTLNETGSFVWEQLDGSRSVADLVDQVVARYEVPRAEADEDVSALIADLVAEGLVQEDPRAR